MDCFPKMHDRCESFAEHNRGKRNHGLPKGITRRPNSVKYECKVHLSGKRFYVGLFSTVDEALQAQAEKRQHLVDAASRDPDGKIEVATRTTGEDEMVKVKAASASGSSLEKVCSDPGPCLRGVAYSGECPAEPHSDR